MQSLSEAQLVEQAVALAQVAYRPQLAPPFD
jgi:hypothetical protein